MTSANGEGPLLGRDAILRLAQDRATLPTRDVPAWGGVVRVRGLTGTGRDEYEASTMVWRNGKAYPDTENARAKLVARCVVGDDGEPLFTQQDVHALGELDGLTLNKVWEVAMELSGLTEADMEELAGNSSAAQSGGSTSGSPVTSARQSASSSRKSPPAS